MMRKGSYASDCLFFIANKKEHQHKIRKIAQENHEKLLHSGFFYINFRS